MTREGEAGDHGHDSDCGAPGLPYDRPHYSHREGQPQELLAVRQSSSALLLRHRPRSISRGDRRVHDQPGPNWEPAGCSPGSPSLVVRGLPDLEVPAFKRGHDADSGFLRVWGCEAGHQATVFSYDVFNPVQRQQASRSGSVTCDGDKVVGHAMGTLLPQPGGLASEEVVGDHPRTLPADVRDRPALLLQARPAPPIAPAQQDVPRGVVPEQCRRRVPVAQQMPSLLAGDVDHLDVGAARPSVAGDHADRLRVIRRRRGRCSALVGCRCPVVAASAPARCDHGDDGQPKNRSRPGCLYSIAREVSRYSRSPAASRA